MKSLITALLITTICSFAQQPPSIVLWKPNSLEVRAIEPGATAALARGQKVTIAIHYNNAGQNAVRIWARPYTRSQPSLRCGSHPSPKYAPGSGDVEGWFSFLREGFVDEVQVTMVDTITNEVIASTKLPVQLTCE